MFWKILSDKHTEVLFFLSFIPSVIPTIRQKECKNTYFQQNSLILNIKKWGGSSLNRLSNKVYMTKD